MATLAYVFLAMSSGDGSTPEVVSFLFFIASLQISWTDLMVEGVYTAKMARRPRYAPDLLSWVWSGINLSSLAGVALAGPLIDTIGPFYTVIVAVPFALAVVPAAAMGWMCEERAEEPIRSKCCAINRKTLSSETNRGFFITGRSRWCW